MKTLRVDLGARSYDIQIAPGLLDRAGEEIRKVCPRAKRIAIVTDANVEPLWNRPDLTRGSLQALPGRGPNAPPTWPPCGRL